MYSKCINTCKNDFILIKFLYEIESREILCNKDDILESGFINTVI